MRSALNEWHFEPVEPEELPDDPAAFSTSAVLTVGTADVPDGGDIFYVQVCTPEALQQRCAEEGFVSGRHLLIVNYDDFSRAKLDQVLHRMFEIDGDTWDDIGPRLARWGGWEFEDYQG